MALISQNLPLAFGTFSSILFSWNTFILWFLWHYILLVVFPHPCDPPFDFPAFPTLSLFFFFGHIFFVYLFCPCMCVSRLFKVSFSSNSSYSIASYSEQSHLSLDYNYNIYSDDPQVYIQTQTLWLEFRLIYLLYWNSHS